MRAHEWTRARQRPVRQIGRALGKLAEDDVQEAVSEPSLVGVELAPEVEPLGEEPEVAVAQEPPAIRGPGPAEEAQEPAGEDAPIGDDLSARDEPSWGERAAVVPAVALIAPEVEATAHSRVARAPTARRARTGLPRQAQLPLQLEPIDAESAARRSATETREDLIQRLLDPHLSLQEAAKLLNVCPTTVRRYTNRGLLAHYRTPGNQRRFRLSDVLAFMERQGIPAHGLERRRPAVMQDGQEDEPS